MSAFAVDFPTTPPPTAPDGAVDPKQAVLNELGMTAPLAFETVNALRTDMRTKAAVSVIEQAKEGVRNVARSGARFNHYEKIMLGGHQTQDKAFADYVLEMATPQFPGFIVSIYAFQHNLSLRITEP